MQNKTVLGVLIKPLSPYYSEVNGMTMTAVFIADEVSRKTISIATKIEITKI
jgi:hypothetical protein